MNKINMNYLAAFGFIFFSSISSAEEIYHCVGKYNTGSDYDHTYTVNRSFLGGTVDWEGDKFKIKEHPLYLYAVAIKSNGVDVLFIENKTLNAEFSSIRYTQPFVAKGKCTKLR